MVLRDIFITLTPKSLLIVWKLIFLLTPRWRGFAIRVYYKLQKYPNYKVSIQFSCEFDIVYLDMF